MPTRDILILCHHAVSATWPADLSVTPERFERQLRLLLRRGYRPTTFHDAFRAEAGTKVLAVTFDDAFSSVLSEAAPILRRLGMPATVFVPTSHAGSPVAMSWPGIDNWLGTPHEAELTALSWDQLRGLSHEGWEIGSHTCTHPSLPALEDAELMSELVESRRRCEEEIGVPCRSVAYPYGHVDPRVVRAAKAAGYSVGAGLPGSRHIHDPLQWPRVGVWREDDERRFALKVSPALRRLQRSSAWTGVARARALARRAAASRTD